MLESVVTLFITCFILMALSGMVRSSFQQVEEQIFFMEFEQFYRESQRLAAAKQERLDLQFHQKKITNGYAQLAIPATIQAPDNLVLHFNQAGGNSSLKKVTFETPRERITYQLFIGNGKIKKTNN